MHDSAIKKQLHEYIDMIEDKSQLEILCETAEAYAKGQECDILNSLTPKQLKRLEESIKHADDGELIRHEKVMKMSRQWLTK